MSSSACSRRRPSSASRRERERVVTIEHVIFIPGIFLLGLAFGWVFGGKSAREAEQKRREARKR